MLFRGDMGHNLFGDALKSMAWSFLMSLSFRSSSTPVQIGLIGVAKEHEYYDQLSKHIGGRATAFDARPTNSVTGSCEKGTPLANGSCF